MSRPVTLPAAAHSAEEAPDRRAEPLRAGILGGGFMGDVHGRAIRAARSVVAGLASSTPESTAVAASRIGAERALTPDELLADPSIEVVHVCTPNATHAEYAARALAAGKHVVCEKPIGTTLAEAERMAEAARASGLVTAVPFVNRFHPLTREARDRLAEDPGAVTTVLGSYLQDWLLEQGDDDWRVDATTGGPSRAFGDIGSHLVDLLEFTTGERIVSLRAVTGRLHATRAGRAVATEDTVAAVITLSGGGIGTLTVSQVAPGRKNALALEIAKPTASYRFEQEDPEVLWVGRRRGSELLLRDPDQLHADGRRLSIVPAGHALGYQNAFDAFVADAYAVIRGEQRPGLPTFEDGLRAARVTDAVLASAREARDVPIP
ncbi:MAG: Gfo/Idh/MocA family oxidoreductase [Micrococcales bacterium]|nr:Gfo/Idh/MocA family oxidoreductase [Micrococcales bacterium]